jgi:hypothetical protein
MNEMAVKIDQMTIKFTTIFHCKALQNLPKLGFLFDTIWQACPPRFERQKKSK